MDRLHKSRRAILILFYLYTANCQLHVENVALTGTCSMTDRFARTGDCREAIDNITSLDLGFGNTPNCIHTIDDPQSGCLPFWQVILKEEYTITNITIFNRAGSTERLTYTNVTVNGILCKSFGSDASSIKDVNTVQCSSPIRGSTVHISRHYPKCETGADYPLNLCEVQVWVCSKGWYGDDCNTPCSGRCRNNATCNRYDGSCAKGCFGGWYGPRCEDSCPQNCNGACNQSSGACFGCSSGWYGSRCDDSCPQNCKGVCNQSSGACFECNGKFYGRNCTETCGNCAEHGNCELTNGYCTECELGWEPPLCQKACNDTHYGQNCREECGLCFGKAACNKETGECLNCEPGRELPLCQKECNDSYYGPNCRENCGNCFGGESCNKVDGSCSACITGWEAPLCKQAPSNSDGAPVGAIAGSVVGAAVVIIAIVLFILVYRRRRPSHKETSNSRLSSQFISMGIMQDGTSDDKNELTGKNKPTTVNLQNNQHFAPSRGESHQSKDKMSHRSNAIVDPRENTVRQKGSTNQLYENVPAADKTPKHENVTASLPATQLDIPIDAYDDDTDTVYNTEDIYSTYKPLVVWDSFQQSLLSSLASGQLNVHFNGLTKGMKHPHTEGVKPENMKKNRFKAILPYDNNRVILQRSKAEQDSDYINASYVKGYLKENAYIAAQGPRAHTVNDFWLMIWQRNTAQIIMLTNVIEGGKDKCVEYWPASGICRTYGNTMVTCLSEEIRADFIIRIFTLKIKGNLAERQVQHYHYVAWPDHGVPSATSLVDFWRYVRAQALPNVLPVVHCSAGVGRTGTYIALDIAMDLVANGRDVNVLKIVTDLREDRTVMVQAEAQYKFLYEVIFEAYTSRNSRFTCEEFDKMFLQPINITNSNTTMDNEFKILKLMREFVPKPQSGISTKKENIIKCRNTSALPDDNHLVYLKGHNQSNTYINAVRMPSFKRRNGALLTQLPLPDTLLDFWRLVDESDVSVIVSLSYKDESKAVKNYCQYWPKSSKKKLTVDQYDINLVDSTVLGNHLTSFNVTIQKEENIRTVHIVHFTNWAGEVPGDPNDVIQILETANTFRSEKEASPVLVQCIDGAAKSGLFCVMSEIFDRVTYDHVIDVFLSVHHVQTVRPQAVTNELQYRFCYKLAQEAKRHQGVYENT